jgi:carboxypeptidase Taq
MKRLEYVVGELTQMAKLGSALGVLGWDKEVNLPAGAHHFRGEVSAMLAGELHKRVTDRRFVDSLKELASPENLKKLSADEQVVVKETWRDVERAIKLPVKFVEDFTLMTNDAFSAWVDARKSAEFQKFQPYLKKVVEFCRKEAELLGYEESPYDALLDGYEPAMTVKKLQALFEPLSGELSQLVTAAAAKKPLKLPKKTYDLDKQKAFNRAIAEAFGYDFNRGRLDESPHPFTTGFHPTDVRITTRYDKDDFWISLGATIHETGHALYEQGLPEKFFATPLGSSVSLGVHESQSRIWENFVGRGRPFVSYFYPKLTKTFGKLPYSQEQLYNWLNRVEPSLIRVEADEVTYNLHVILRFEIEKQLIEGDLTVEELPHIWNQKMDDYLGVQVPNDSQGVLQDVHWSHGSFGYFPTYSLGNLYSAQLYSAITKDLPSIETDFADGNFRPFLEWLRDNIHRHGRRYQPEELIERASKEPLSSAYLLDHLASKVQS